MNDQRIIQISEKYREKGLIAYGEFLLEPSLAIELLTELTEAGIRVVGSSSWAYLFPDDKSSQFVYEFFFAGPWIEKPFENSLEQNARMIKDFIQDSLPQDAELVGLVIDDPQITGSLADLITSPEECLNH